MKRTSRDRLDGSDKKSWIKEIYMLPGRIILWINYMFPSKGMQNITKSARHAKSPIMTFLYSTGFWLFASLVAYAYILEELAKYN